MSIVGTLRQLTFLGQRNLWKPFVATTFSLTSPSQHSRQASTSEKYIIRSKCPPISTEKQHFADFLWKDAVEKYGDRTALINAPTGESFTFAESRKQCDLFAAALTEEASLKKGDVLAIYMPNNPEYVFAYTGATELGVTLTTINPMYTPSEIARQLRMSKSKMALTLSALLPRMKEALQKLEGGDKIKIIVLDADDHSADGKILSYAKLMRETSGSFKRADFDFDDIVALPYSSGTTGAPKGVMLSHKNLVVNSRQVIYSEGFGFIRFPTSTFQPSTVCIMPLFHAYGSIATTFNTLHPGGKVALVPSFEPKTFIEYMRKYKPNFMHFAPPLVAFCASHPEIKAEHLADIEYVFVGAAPVGEALMKLFQKKAPHCSFREGWGMTELSPIGVMTPHDDIVPGSCGLALPNTEVKVIDLKTGEALPPHKPGELCIRGPQVMVGYLDNPEATKHTITEDGWLKSGDIAYYDETDHVYIVDRLKELIKVKGYQVPPAELEDLLRSHPKVNDVAVIGIPHERMGEVPRAYIVKSDQALTEEEVHAYINEEVTDYKKLRGGIEFLDAVPKSPSGKILRRELVEAWKGKK